MQQNQIQTQAPQQNTTPNPKPKRPARKTAITLVIIITIIALRIAAINGLLPTLWNINSNGWANIILGVGTLLGVVFAFIAILPQDTKDTPAPAAPHYQPIPPIVNITNVMPSLPSSPQLTPTAPLPLTPALNNSYKSDIRSLPPPTDPASTQQRSPLVKEVYAELTAANHSGVVLQGLGGIGKFTLAALIFKYAEQQRTTGKGPFTAEALWRDSPTSQRTNTANICLPFDYTPFSPKQVKHL